MRSILFIFLAFFFLPVIAHSQGTPPAQKSNDLPHELPPASPHADQGVPDQIPPRFSAENLQALASAKEVILYSLDPEPPEPKQVRSGEIETFHGWHVLGKAKLTGGHASMATSAVDAALNLEEKKPHDSDYEQEFSQCILRPRHGLAFQSDGHNYDVVLCYECGQMLMYRDGKETEYNANHGSPQILDSILTEGHIPLPPPAVRK